MKQIIFASLFLLTAQVSLAQKSKAVVLNAANIEKVLTGDWKVIKVQPTDKVASIVSFSMKGAGYGEIAKLAEDGNTKTIFSKIYGQNQNSIVFADAEGSRVAYKIVSLSTTYMQLSDGEVTLDFVKE